MSTPIPLAQELRTAEERVREYLQRIRELEALLEDDGAAAVLSKRIAKAKAILEEPWATSPGDKINRALAALEGRSLYAER